MCGISGIYNLFNKDIDYKKIIEKIIKPICKDYLDEKKVVFKYLSLLKKII